MIDEHLDDPSRAPRWLTPVATTLGAWLVAFLVVTALLTIFGDELQQMPLALRALLISGVLVALMVNLVMPVLSRCSPACSLARPGRGCAEHGAGPTLEEAQAMPEERERQPSCSLMRRRA
jgi:hypothetical protein